MDISQSLSTLIRGRARCLLGMMVGETCNVVMLLASLLFEDTVTKSCPIGLPNGLLREVTSGNERPEGTLSSGNERTKDTLSLGNECPESTLSPGNERTKGTLSLGNEYPEGTLSSGNERTKGTLSSGNEDATGTL
jgi:hypothetical protein